MIIGAIILTITGMCKFYHFKANSIYKIHKHIQCCLNVIFSRFCIDDHPVVCWMSLMNMFLRHYKDVSTFFFSLFVFSLISSPVTVHFQRTSEVQYRLHCYQWLLMVHQRVLQSPWSSSVSKKYKQWQLDSWNIALGPHGDSWRATGWKWMS